jgi:hypothetical protein
LGELLTRYRDQVSPTKRSAHTEKARINAMVRRPIAHRTLAKLTSADVATYRELFVYGCCICRIAGHTGYDQDREHQEDASGPAKHGFHRRAFPRMREQNRHRPCIE